MTLKFNNVRVVVKVRVLSQHHQAGCSGLWVIVLTNFLPYLAVVKNRKIGYGSVTLTCEWLWNSIGFVRLPRYMWRQNFIKLSIAFAIRAFRCFAPATWNSLPRTVTDSNSLGTFKSRLKTFLFSLAYNWYWHCLPPAPLKLRPNGAIQIYYYLLLLLLAVRELSC